MSTPGDALPVGTDDFVAIQRLIHRYADAVIHRNGVQWSSCWAEDARWDLGRGRQVEGREAIVAMWYGAMKAMSAVVQNVHNGDVWRTADDGDDAATGRWYISERFLRADGSPGVLFAHYDDRYVCVDGGWTFSERYLEVHYIGAPDLTADFLNQQATLVARGVPADV